MCSHVHQWNMPVVVAIFHAWSSLPSTCYNQFCCWLHPPTHLVWFPLARFTLENKKNIQLVLFEPRSEKQCWQRSCVRCQLVSDPPIPCMVGSNLFQLRNYGAWFICERFTRIYVLKMVVVLIRSFGNAPIFGLHDLTTHDTAMFQSDHRDYPQNQTGHTTVINHTIHMSYVPFFVRVRCGNPTLGPSSKHHLSSICI